jgi:hypothetical protein
MSNSFDNVQGGQGGGMLDQRELARIAAYEQDIAETRHDRDIDWYVASGLGVTAIVTAASRAVAESMERRIPLAGAPQPAAGPSAQ